MTLNETMDRLKAASNEETLHEMAKMGINTAHALGVPLKDLRAIIKDMRRDHALALELWATGINEARIIAVNIADKSLADDEFLEKWVSEINSWDLCDQFCTALASKTESGKMKMYQWAVQDEMYIKRAGFALMAIYALKDEALTENEVDSFSTLIMNECDDSRTYVKKAVAWALKNIGKRDEAHRLKAVKIAKAMRDLSGKTGKSTATEVLSELNSPEEKNRHKPKKKSY